MKKNKNKFLNFYKNKIHKIKIIWENNQELGINDFNELIKIKIFLILKILSNKIFFS